MNNFILNITFEKKKKTIKRYFPIHDTEHKQSVCLVTTYQSLDLWYYLYKT